MIEMNVILANSGEELRVAVQVHFRFAPVKLRGPVLGQRLHVIPVGAVAPIIRLKAVRPVRLTHAVEDSVDGCLRNIDAEGSWHGTGSLSIRSAFCQQGNAARCKKRFQQHTSRHVSKDIGFHVSLLVIPV